MRGFVLSLFLKLDMFKSPIYLLFSKQHKTPTKTGSFISLAIIIYLAIISLQSDLFQKNSPTLLISDLPQSNREKVDLTKKILGFGLQNENGLAFIDPGIFSIEVTYAIRNELTNFEVIETPIRFHECTELDFDDPGVFHELTLDKNYCLKKNESIFSQGYWDENNLAYLAISLKYCRNETSNGTCKTQEEMEEKFNGKNFNIYLEDTIIDIYDYKNPVKKTIRNEYKSVDLIFNKILEINMQNVYIYSDDGIFNQEIDSFLEVKYNYQIFDFYTKKKNDEDNIIFQFEIFASKNVLKLNRSYQKLFDLLGIIGGLYEIFKLIGLFFVQFEFNLFVQRKIINILFTTPKSYSYREKKNKRIQIKTKILSSKLDFDTKLSLSQPAIPSKLAFSVIEFLKLGFKKMMKIKLTAKEEYFSKGEEKLKKKIELPKILTLLQQMKFMKKILLTPDQKKLFKYMKKSCIEIKPRQDKLKNKMEFIDIMTRFEERKAQNRLSEVDFRMLSCFDIKFPSNDLSKKKSSEKMRDADKSLK